MTLRFGVALCVVLLPPLSAQNDWPAYGHDPGGMRYSPLKQITAANVAKLHRAWTFHTGEAGRQFETTPIVAGGRMYLSTQSGRIVALEPETGKQIWSFDPKVERPREHRGVAYWPGEANSLPRIIFGTGDGRLIALDANTGQPVPAFGDNGQVNLRAGVADRFPKASYGMTSPPAIYRNLVIVGPSTQEGPSRGPAGDPRAFDARTGKLVWQFHTVPQPAEPGNDTWGPDGWKDRAGPSLWGLINVDSERGLVILATGNPADSFYGGDRKGTNLYANCVLALDGATGKLRWHYQLTHHDIFDYDVPGNPALIEAVQDGRRIPAVAQITKMGLLFILDRTTGRPIFGAKEVPVPASDVPGEEAWPTQPFPLKPPPLGRISIRRDELTHRTPEAERYCRELFDKMQVGTLYTPFGTKTTLVFPGAMGGGNWGGVSFDPSLGYVFVNTSNMAAIGHMTPSAAGAPMPYRNESGYARFLDPDHYPCQRPPWGELSAVDTATGDIAWRVPLGNFDELASQGMKNTGTPNVGGSIATAGGIVFIAATNDARLRAFDSRTGKELWAGRLDASGNATPITYLGKDGQQYVVIAAGGPAHLRNVGDTSANSADTLIAFSLAGREPEAAPLVTHLAPPAVAAPSVSLPEAEDKPLVERMCGQCHGVGTFAQSRMSPEEWKAVVADMVARGATGTPEEIRIVESYLAKNLAGPAGTRNRR
jgi:quinoprotein glucose dehydrogenase